MRLLLSGASGLIGAAVHSRAAARGDEVWSLVRRPPSGKREIEWPSPAPPAPELLEGFDAVVHLAGASIASGLWTGARKRVLRDSRIQTTEALCRALAATRGRPAVLVCASAVGAYGDSGDATVDEDSPVGSGFLAELVRDWEAASQEAERAGIRVVRMRFGIVLASGGALAGMLLPFRLGLGARLGDGRQWMSWVAHEDAVSALLFALENEELRGPVNVVAGAVRNANFTRSLAAAVRRPAPWVAPAALLRLLPGGFGHEVLLAGQRVRSTRLAAAGFAFEQADLDQTLRGVVS